MIHRFLLGTVALCLTLTMHAADGEAKLTLRALALRPLVEKELWLSNNGRFVAMAISDNQPTAAQQAHLTSPLLVFRGPLDGHGKPRSLQPVSVPLPANVTNVLLLAWPAADSTRIIAIPDDFAKATPSSWLLVNTTRQPLAFQLGADSTPITIQPGSHLSHTITAPAGQGAAAKLAMPDNGKWKTIYSTYWPVDPRKRSIVLLVEDGRKIRVKLITDESSGY